MVKYICIVKESEEGCREERRKEEFSLEVICVVHLDPLPGSPLYTSFDEVLKKAVKDATTALKAGADGIIVENYGDKPFLKRVGREVVACMTSVICEIKSKSKLKDVKLGVNVLRNDAFSAIAIAKAVNADFVRVNQLYFSSLSPEGWLEGLAGELMRYRRFIDCNAKVFADVNVKHSHQFVSIEEYAENLSRSLADAIIVTGSTTGREVRVEELKFFKEVTDIPVYVGSGVTPKNAGKFIDYADGIIVGTYIKKNGRIDFNRVREIINAVR